MLNAVSDTRPTKFQPVAYTYYSALNKLVGTSQRVIREVFFSDAIGISLDDFEHTKSALFVLCV